MTTMDSRDDVGKHFKEKPLPIRNVLITGGGGNVAEFTAKELREHDYRITLFDRRPPHQHPEYPWQTDLPFVLGDLTSLGDCMRAITISQADAIVHLGGLPGPSEFIERFPLRRQQQAPEDETMRVNTMGTFYLVDAARRLRVEKVVMASTFFVLGIGNRISGNPFKVDYLPIDESHPCRPESTYGLSKVCGEEILQAFSRAYGLQTIALRLMGVDGKRARGLPPIPAARAPQHPELRPELLGAPEGLIHDDLCTFQYVDVRDAALACRLSLEVSGLDTFETFFISTDTLLDEDIRTIVERVYPNLRTMTAGLDRAEGIVSIRKAREKLGYQPRHSWRQ